jgi:carbon-monoxide dehydrogenase small subunit
VVLTVNGVARTARVPARRLLSDLLRHDLRLTGTHVGCEHGVCGACTVLLDGEPVRSCLMLAVQADTQSITTIEGVSPADGGLHPIQEAFWAKHGLQCGYCTPGIVMSACAFLRERPRPTREEIREMLAGHLCRCTGYHFIVEAIEAAAQALAPPPPRTP